MIANQHRLPDPHVAELASYYEEPNAHPEWVRKLVDRVTSGLVQCSITILSAGRKSLVENSFDGAVGLTRSEAFVAAHYRALGCKVVRLEHTVASGLGRGRLGISKIDEARERLRGELIDALPYSAYEQFATVNQHTLDEVRVLNEAALSEYPLSSYPPDFVMGLSGHRFVFVEVKSATDALHFKQANWFLNLKPLDWQYEIVATVPRRLGSPLRVPEGRNKEGPNWQRALQSAEKERSEFQLVEDRRKQREDSMRDNPSFGSSPSRAAQVRWIKEHLSKL